jgi:hypothetical protein
MPLTQRTCHAELDSASLCALGQTSGFCHKNKTAAFPVEKAAVCKVQAKVS